MKEVSAEFIRLEIMRLGALVVDTGLFHPSGVRLHAPGEILALPQARGLHDAGISRLYLLDGGEDERNARKALGVEYVLPAAVVEGDRLAEDLRRPGGELLLPSGTTVEEKMLDLIRSASVLAVPIRHRRLDVQTRQAQDYRDKLPAGDSGPLLPAPTPGTAVRPLLSPRARILVGMTNDLLRTLLINTLKSQGHEVVARRSPLEAVEDIHAIRPHVLVLDLGEAIPALVRLRESSGVRAVTALVCVEDPASALIPKALQAGANDWLPRPPGRDVLQEKLRGCQDILGRRVQLPPSFRNERRQGARQAGRRSCGLRDSRPGAPLPVLAGDLLDLSEGGLRIAFNRPRGSCPWAYAVNGVHPRHAFYAHAACNPAGRSLQLLLPGSTVEKRARIVHLRPQDDVEIMGLRFDSTVPGETQAVQKTRRL